MNAYCEINFTKDRFCPATSFPSFQCTCLVAHCNSLICSECVLFCVFIYPCDCFCVIQTACRQIRAFPVQTGSAVTVPSVETKQQGNTTEPPAATAARASSDAPYARAMCTPAGTESRKCVSVCERDHRHAD